MISSLYSVYRCYVFELPLKYFSLPKARLGRPRALSVNFKMISFTIVVVLRFQFVWLMHYSVGLYEWWKKQNIGRKTAVREKMQSVFCTLNMELRMLTRPAFSNTKWIITWNIYSTIAIYNWTDIICWCRLWQHATPN
jgi:hypothetical protein